MKISDRRLRISDSLKISDFSNSLGVLQNPQQYAYEFQYFYHTPTRSTSMNRIRHRQGRRTLLK